MGALPCLEISSSVTGYGTIFVFFFCHLKCGCHVFFFIIIFCQRNQKSDIHLTLFAIFIFLLLFLNLIGREMIDLTRQKVMEKYNLQNGYSHEADVRNHPQIQFHFFFL